MRERERDKERDRESKNSATTATCAAIFDIGVVPKMLLKKTRVAAKWPHYHFLKIAFVTIIGCTSGCDWGCTIFFKDEAQDGPEISGSGRSIFVYQNAYLCSLIVHIVKF